MGQEFTHPQQVRDLLAATIGEEVFNQMAEQDPIHRAGNPLPAPPVPANPVPAAPATPPAAAVPTAPPANPVPAAVPAAPADSPAPATGQPEAVPGRLLGKYDRTPEGERLAEDSYHRLLHANKELMRQVSALQGSAPLQAPTAQAPTTHEAPRVDPTVRAAGREEILKTWQEKYGVEAADLESLKAIAREAVLEEIGPERAYRSADQFMAEHYPESLQHRDELIQFVQTDPQLGPRVADMWKRGEYTEAMELAWLKYDTGRRATAERSMLANAQVRQEEVDRARVDAGLVTSQVSGVHAASEKQYGPTQEEMEKLQNLYRAGYKEPWLRAAIGSTLPDELFGIDGQ